jgi:hypothetical protein
MNRLSPLDLGDEKRKIPHRYSSAEDSALSLTGMRDDGVVGFRCVEFRDVWGLEMCGF